MRTLRCRGTACAVRPQSSHSPSLSRSPGSGGAGWLMYVGPACPAESGRTRCLCADEGGVRSALWGLLSRVGQSISTAFSREKKEPLPGPSITAEAASGAQCHRSVPRERAPRAPRARPFLPGPGCAEPGCQATHVPTHMHMQEECSAHPSARLCAHMHASMEISRHPHGCTHMHPHASVRRMPCAHMYASAEISMCMHHACAPTCTRKPLLLRPGPRIPGSEVFTGRARRAGHGQEAGRWLSLSCSWTPQRPSVRSEGWLSQAQTQAPPVRCHRPPHGANSGKLAAKATLPA